MAKLTLTGNTLYEERPEKVECLDVKFHEGRPVSVLFQLTDRQGRKIGNISVDVLGNMQRSIDEVIADCAKDVYGTLTRLAASAERLTQGA